MSVTGTPAHIAKAKTLIDARLREEDERLKRHDERKRPPVIVQASDVSPHLVAVSQHVATTHISSIHSVAAVLGRGGEHIPELRTNMGCDLRAGPPDPTTDTQPVTLVGPPHAVASASALLSSLLEQARYYCCVHC